MARNDVYLNINALSPADAVVTGQQDMTAATVPELVLGDTPTFNFYFTDNTNVWPSWAGNAAYTLTWALSDAVAGDFSPAATTGNATPITGGWSVLLPLNSYDLVGLLNTKRVGQPYPVTNLWQQLRVTDPSGNEVTRAMFWTPVRYRAISDTQNTESASPTGGRFVTVNNVNTLTTPTAAQFYSANPVPTSALGSAANGELLIGNGTGFTKATLTAGSGVSITNGSGSITISATDGDITLDDGTAAAPSLKFTSDPDTGIYRPAANTLGVAVGGAQIAYFDANGITTVGAGATFDGSVHAANGNANNPSLSFTSDDNTGFFRHQPDEIGIALGGTQTGTLTAALATLTSKLLVSSGATTTAATDLLVNPAVKASGNLLDLQVASSSKFSVSSAGNATFGGNLTVSGTGTSSVAGSLLVSGGSVANLIGLRSTSTSGYAESAFYDAANNKVGAIGFGNSATAAPYTNAVYINTLYNTVPIVFAPNGTAALTLSGTGNTTLAGNLTVSGGTITGGTSGLSLAAGGTNQNITLTPSGTGSVAFSRWVAASATAPSTLAAGSGAIYFKANGSVAGTQDSWIFNTGYTDQTYRFQVAGTDRMVIAANTGNLLVGTTTDTGQKLQVAGNAYLSGKLELATHTTSAGGIGFGTALSMYRSGDNSAWIDAASGNVQLVLGRAGTANLAVLSDGSYVYASAAQAGMGMILRTNGGTTALTLDSSQNATFAGNVTLSKVGPKFFLTDTSDTSWSVRSSAGYYLFKNETANIDIARFTGSTLSSAKLEILATTASTSTTTGALVVSGGVGVAGAANVGTYYGMVDGVTAPAATSGYAKIYVDTADGDLKVIFGDGTIKTLATDT